jgi:hypothetical protein
MSAREKRREDVQTDVAEQQPSSPQRDHIDTLQRCARDLLSTARQLIDNTISGESEDYLDAVRQKGGQ